MGLKDDVMELLRQGADAELAGLVQANNRTVRHLVGRLWDPDEAIRGRAARALGEAAASHPERGLRLIRRLLWDLNDESATNGIYGIPALGEMGRRNPELFAPFVAPLASISADEGLRLEVLRALDAIARTSPRLVAAELDRIKTHIDPTNTHEMQAFQQLERTAAGSTEAS